MGRSARFARTGHARRGAVVVLVALALAAAVAGALAGPGPANGTALPPALTVTTSSAEVLRLDLGGLEPQWRELPAGAGGPPRWVLSLPGFVSGGAPGTPRLPSTGGWLVVPPGTRPELRVLNETWTPAAGRPLALETLPVVLPGDPLEPGRLAEWSLLPGQTLPEGVVTVPGLGTGFGARTGPAVELGSPVWWRGRRVAALRVVPVRHDAQGVAMATLSDGRWEVRFVPDVAVTAAVPPSERRALDDGRRDVRFADVFLNGGLLTSLPTEARAGGWGAAAAAAADAPAPLPRAGADATLLGPEARLAVTRTGPVRVSYSRLRQRGLIPDVPIQESQVRLYQRRYLDRLDTGSGAPWVEIEVPIHLFGEGDLFDGDDFFIFHGLRLRDDGSFVADVGAGPEQLPGCGDATEMNNETNVYWLACATPGSGQSWARMATTTLPAATGAPLASFRHQAHLEEQTAYRENPPTTTADRMYLNMHIDTEASLAVSPFWRPDPAGAAVDLSVALAGFNNETRQLRLDLVTGTSSVTPLEEFPVTTDAQILRTYTVPATAIDGTSTRVRLSRGTGSTFPFLFAYLNWYEIAYDALYQAVDGELRFHGGEVAGDRPLVVTGFGNADLGLLEITDPRAPVFVALQAGNIVQNGGTWSLSVMPTQTAGVRRVFHAVGGLRSTGVPEFNYVKSTVAGDPGDPTLTTVGDPDLVVVTHGDFRAALARWVQHRVTRSGGELKVHVVDVEDLYDWYSGGLRDPWAVKRFTNHALTTWESWALVLVGDANENALGKRVLTAADSWSHDWVPTHYHRQRALNYTPELMACDKWFVTLQSGQNYPVEDFPLPVATPTDMLVGRLPCNSVAELDVMVDKIIAVETPQAGQDWRRRGFFIADDEWSNGYGAEALTTLRYENTELDFLESERDSLAAQWAVGTGVPLDAALVSLKDALDPQFPYTLPNPPSRPIGPVRQYTAAAATPALLAALNQGGLFASYQGHANQYVLSSEYWLQDMPTIPGERVDTTLLANNGKPWFFIGLGCHIADWAQNAAKNDALPQERSIGEKLLLRPQAGASAVYASSGYEYISLNRVFGEYISRRWTKRPPVIDAPGPGGSRPGRSRWVLGELLWAAEADLAAGLPYIGPPYNEMVAQYELLGDPLMTLDGGEPQVTATLHGPSDQTVSGTVELVALDESGVRTLTVAARDEAGIDRLEVVDDQGNDLTSTLVVENLPAGAATHQRVNYALTVPVLPYDHALTVRVFDTGAALPGDRHWELTLDMPQTAVLVAGGQAHDPATFVFETGVPVPFSGTVATSAWITPDMALTLTSGTLALDGVQFSLDKGRGLSVQFTATAPADGSATGHAVTLGIDGHATEIVLQAAPDDGGMVGIGRVLNYPNPMGADTRFLVETGLTGDGRINLWSVAGSPVARLTFAASGDDAVVDWDGRDVHGDQLGNGTYLYRVEIAGPLGTARSEMQRLVIMR